MAQIVSESSKRSDGHPLCCCAYCCDPAAAALGLVFTVASHSRDPLLTCRCTPWPGFIKHPSLAWMHSDALLDPRRRQEKPEAQPVLAEISCAVEKEKARQANRPSPVPQGRHPHLFIEPTA
eukprot:scpid55961/ scgid13083/ 